MYCRLFPPRPPLFHLETPCLPPQPCRRPRAPPPPLEREATAALDALRASFDRVACLFARVARSSATLRASRAPATSTPTLTPAPASAAPDAAATAASAARPPGVDVTPDPTSVVEAAPTDVGLTSACPLERTAEAPVGSSSDDGGKCAVPSALASTTLRPPAECASPPPPHSLHGPRADASRDDTSALRSHASHRETPGDGDDDEPRRDGGDNAGMGNSSDGSTDNDSRSNDIGATPPGDNRGEDETADAPMTLEALGALMSSFDGCFRALHTQLDALLRESPAGDATSSAVEQSAPAPRPTTTGRAGECGGA